MAFLTIFLSLLMIAEGRISIWGVERKFLWSLSLHDEVWSSLPIRKYLSLKKLRGGSKTALQVPSTSKTSETPPSNDAERQYQLQQLLLLQSRSFTLRKALISRGLKSLQFTKDSTDQPKLADWDCAVSTVESPKTCLISFEPELGTKLIKPSDSPHWITLTVLNRLRRIDPSNVEPLWYSQYAILKSWFDSNSPYSLYSYLSPQAAVLSFLLDSPMIYATSMALTIVFLFMLTFPIWEAILTNALTSSGFWLQWPNWARVVHAPLPLKLFLGQLAWKSIAGVLGKLHTRVRNELIELECQLWEECIPLTIVNKNDGGYKDEHVFGLELDDHNENTVDLEDEDDFPDLGDQATDEDEEDRFT